MLKYYVLIVLLIFSIVDAKAQSLEIGYDASQLLTGFLSNKESVSDYPFTLKKANNEGTRAFRAGFGLDISLDNTDIVANQFQLITDQYNTNLRLGYEWRKVLYKKLYLHTGIDVLGGYGSISEITNNDISVTEFVTTDLSFGVGPVLGIQWHIGKNFLLYTEANFYFNFNMNTKKLSDKGLEFVDQSRSNSFNARLASPSELFICYKF